MKAAVIPEVNGTWELQEVPTPQPGPGEVLIRVRACGVCFNDVLSTMGAIPFPAGDPAVAGHEPVGEVVELGEGVTARAVGDRVGVTWVRAGCGRCDYCQRHLPVTGQTAMNCPAPTATGFSAPGGHAEYLAVRATETVLLPEGLDFALAAPVLCAGYTAWSALRTAAPLPHERVAVLGIGGLGHLAVQFARASGVETVAVTGSADKHEAIRRLGADHIVASGDELRELGGADVILVTAPSHRAASAALPALRVNGRMVIAGIDGMEPFTIPPAMTYPFFAQGQRIMGATHNGPRYLSEALALVAAGRVTPVVETFPAERVAEAVARTAKGEARFRAVVRY
ncbi:alcohol dehydrogenase catalytic domain-containing protein [Solwaraspora sp. WMMA2056]|uniref:alcohol dehydrogenase catalytic domain-containing protein n=1 Tax=Solwaraspora sp. WMMA2056 TaxID=3015161 RepID=UPI00259AFC91|nr:alcohol dehydrogenase catalytic domain-containing protein [Solwaraspora sp. WMMA2056]WJK42586.1 alcohol dehydrogenase catalytic domain-containing protein [Solwaraspora sp. WMMA2056]